jgi:hypothetical protein
MAADVAAKCILGCGSDIDPATDFQQVVGWERITPPPSTKGKSVHAQERKKIYACRWCIERLKRGISLDQESLL